MFSFFLWNKEINPGFVYRVKKKLFYFFSPEYFLFSGILTFLYYSFSQMIFAPLSFISSPEQPSWRAIVLPSLSALALAVAFAWASASTDVKVFVKVFKT